MMNKFFQKLQECFPDKSIQLTEKGLNESINKHGIYAGYRNADDGKSLVVGGDGFSWLEDGAMGVSAPYA